ncbi:hypothetical protein DFH09DRAFT_1300204 [Mycena vulgaris]|nr:hypothetical protein DFH09DRAFT_1300204 [Mycena vulgaris]
MAASFAISALAVVPIVSAVVIQHIAWPWDPTKISVLFTRIARLPPDMQVFSLEDCTTTVPYTELCEMLAARWDGRSNESRIKSFRLVRDRKGDPDESVDPVLAAKLRALVEAGFHLHIEAYRLPTIFPQ